MANFRGTNELRLILIKDKHPVQLDDDATLFRGQLRGTTAPKDSSVSFCSFGFVFLPPLLVFPVFFLFSSFLSLWYFVVDFPRHSPSALLRHILQLSDETSDETSKTIQTNRAKRKSAIGRRKVLERRGCCYTIVDKFQRKCTSKEMEPGLVEIICKK